MIGYLNNVTRDYFTGKTLVTFAFDEINRDMLNKLNGLKLLVTAKKWSPKKSDRANRYFWELIGQLAFKLRIDNWTCYLMTLRSYGVFYSVDILSEAYEMLKESYRYTEITEEYEVTKSDGYKEWNEDRCSVNVFPGISTYNSSEFTRLVDGLIDDCKEQGIETLPPDEVKAMLAVWKGGRDEEHTM